ncbi:MAG: hypothetical protein JWP88_436, partial [Flaviaesturariibacter sp.]|nr:hypothetical protein [Flaviaesturariibacter sp.]
FGVIPMTNAEFPRRNNNIRYIGTAGGHTKASSGYTFQFIQKETAAIVQCLEQHGHPFSKPVSAPRFSFYDEVLLSVLYHKRLPGRDIFSRLFQKNDPKSILRFLDNETTLAEEMAIISSLPTLPFAKAAFWKLPLISRLL